VILTMVDPTLQPPPPEGGTRKAAKRKEQASRHPWRDNIEAITMAIVMAVMLKYFIVEAYKIPTGSMQPTLMGNDETGIKDRILVDKLSYHFRDPERWEVTVFKYPLDLSKNFIKRLVGVGPEELRIEHGDLWHRPEGEPEWTILRRPRGVQEEVWKPLHPGQKGLDGWRPINGAKGWTIDEGSVTARGTGSLRYPDGKFILDDYRDGYDLAYRDEIAPKPRGGPGNSVGDVRLSGEVEALPGCSRITFELREGSRRYEFTLPGPAAAEDLPAITAAEMVPGTPSLLEGRREAIAEEPWRLPAGSSVEFAVQNMDDLLSLELDGEVVLELEIPPAVDQTCFVQIDVEGEGADFEDLMVYRDIYYLAAGVERAYWRIPAGHYVMLGDNTQDSSDSREWKFIYRRYPKPDGPVYRGNSRPGENPRELDAGGSSGGVTWFRDEFGELHTWPTARVEAVPATSLPAAESEEVALVPRDLITGRAVVVFWPLKPTMLLWRLKWIH